MHESSPETFSTAGEKSKSATLPSALQRQLERHFTTCTVTMGSAVALAAAVPAARGTVIYDISDVAIAPNNQGGVYFDLEAGTTSPFATGTTEVNIFDFVKYSSYSMSFIRYQQVAGYNGGTVVGAAPFIENVAANTLIGPSSGTIPIGILAFQYVSSSTGSYAKSGRYGGFAAGTGLLGVKFTGADGTTDYGWMRLSVDPNTGDLTVLDYAYDNSGAAILAGEVPEPGTCALGCLAAGAAGLGVWRKRRQARQAAPVVSDPPAA